MFLSLSLRAGGGPRRVRRRAFDAPAAFAHPFGEPADANQFL